MRYLTSAVITEGVSDDRFLPFLLHRLIEDVCMNQFEDDVDIEQVAVLRREHRPPNIPEIIELVLDNADTYHLVFVHRDQGANPERVRREWIAPLMNEWRDQWAERLVPVIPVRETEAWVLADGDALRMALGVSWTDADLGVPPKPRLVEEIVDPKVPIERLVRRRGRPLDDFAEELAESISLDVLSLVPSFNAVRECVIGALADIGYRRRPGR